jgi:hypothetical protein
MRTISFFHSYSRFARMLAGVGFLILAPPIAHAAFVGYHEGTIVSATWGWVCQGPTTRVKVFFKTYIGGVLTQIGTTTANRNRPDVASTCGGDGYHGFVFTDYPQSIMDGQAHDIYVYGKKNDGSLVLLTTSPHNVSFAITGLWDPGLINGRWRTDYYSQTAGTSSSPLTLDADQQQQCYLWGAAYYPVLGAGPSPTGNECLTSMSGFPFPNSYSASSDGNFFGPNFWVLTANSEYGYLTPNNLGPPNQTDPISVPGTGLMAIAVLPDNEGGVPSRKKAHIIVNKQLEPQERKSNNKIPFLSYGVQSDWGNGHGVLTLLRQAGAPNILSFAITLFDIYPEPNSPRFNSGYVIVEAQWGGKKRWAYISVLNRNNNNVGAIDTNQGHFNWNILQGVWFPGADGVFKNADTLDSECAPRVPGWITIGSPQSIYGSRIDPAITYNNTPNPGPTTARYTYTIDLMKLFTCLSPDFTHPMPGTGNIPITAVHFAVEESHDAFDLDNGQPLNPQYVNYTWIAVDSVTLQ